MQIKKSAVFYNQSNGFCLVACKKLKLQAIYKRIYKQITSETDNNYIKINNLFACKRTKVFWRNTERFV